VISYNGGAVGYDLTVDIQCDNDVPFYPINISAAENTNLLVSFKSKVGCKYGQLSAIWQFFQDNNWAMFALFTIIGASLCLFGRALLKPTLFLTGVLLAAFIIIYIFYTTFLRTTT
jgi:hypothetical protein